jgi:hypothetical protein
LPGAFGTGNQICLGIITYQMLENPCKVHLERRKKKDTFPKAFDEMRHAVSFILKILCILYDYPGDCE